MENQTKEGEEIKLPPGIGIEFIGTPKQAIAHINAATSMKAQEEIDRYVQTKKSETQTAAKIAQIFNGQYPDLDVKQIKTYVEIQRGE